MIVVGCTPPEGFRFSVFGLSVYYCSARLCVYNNITVVIWLYGITMMCRYKILYRISLQIRVPDTSERLNGRVAWRAVFIRPRKAVRFHVKHGPHVTSAETRQRSRDAAACRWAARRRDAAHTFTSPYTWRVLQDGRGVLATRVCCNYYCILSF